MIIAYKDRHRSMIEYYSAKVVTNDIIITNT